MTAGARAPSGCSDSLLFCLSFPSVCHRVFVSSPSSCRYVVPCVTLFFLCGPFGVRRRFLSLSLSRFLSLPLSLFVVRVVARGSFCICCRSVPWVIVHFVSLFFSSWFFVFVCSSRPSSCFVRFVRVCTLAVWWLNWLSDGHVSPRGLGCLLGAQPLRVGSSFLRGSGSSCGGAPLHRWLRQYVVEVLSPVRVVSRPPPLPPLSSSSFLVHCFVGQLYLFTRGFFAFLFGGLRHSLVICIFSFAFPLSYTSINPWGPPIEQRRARCRRSMTLRPCACRLAPPGSMGFISAK